MREDAQPGKFLVKVSRNSRRALADGQKFGHDIVALPRSTPRLAGRSDRQLFVKRQLLDVDTLVT